MSPEGRHKNSSFYACCPLAQKKYINPDGSIDEDLLKKLKEDSAKFNQAT
jgi:hypothetical protein